MIKSAAIAGLVLIIFGSVPARADDKAESALPARVETHHTIKLSDHRLDYDAIAETFALTDQKGATTAQIFTVSYLAAAVTGPTRPVSFVFNGGPGAASVFLHLGALGPKIMETPANGDAPSPRFASSTIRRPGFPLPISSLSIRSERASVAVKAKSKIRRSRSGTCMPISTRSMPWSGCG